MPDEVMMVYDLLLAKGTARRPTPEVSDPARASQDRGFGQLRACTDMPSEVNAMPHKVISGYDPLPAESPAWPQTLDVSDPTCSLEVSVIFTDLQATTRALQTAADLASNLHGRIRLVVPQVVPFPLPLDSPPVLVKFQEERFRRLACELPVETRVEIYLCRDADELLFERLEPRSVVVIGARKPRWPTRWFPTREKALARKLRRKGHEVMLAYME